MASEVTALAGVCSDVSYGYTASATTEPIGPKFLRITDIQGGKFDWDAVPYCEATQDDVEKYALAVGDIVVARTGNSTGENAQVVALDGDAVFASYLIRFRVDENRANPFFVGYQLRSSRFREFVLSIRGGSAQPGANAKQLGTFDIQLPPRQVQNEAVAVLRALDDRIANLRQTNATLQAIAAALFKSRFVDFDGMPPEDMQESELGLIPKGWRVGSFDEAIEILGGGTPKTSVAEYWDGDIPWFSVVDAPANGQVFVLDTEKKITTLGLENCSAKLLPEMTTIISARGTVGKVAMIGMPMAMNQSCYALRSKVKGGEAFVYFSTLRFVEHLQRIAHGAVFDTITRDSFKQIPAYLPTDEVIAAFGEIANSLLERIRANGQQAATLAILRDTVLPKLISGELRVNNVERGEAIP